MGSDTVLKLDYLSLAELAARPAAWWQDVMGIAAFDADEPPAPFADIPMVAVRIPLLGGSPQRYEVWRSDQGMRSGERGRIQYKVAAGTVFGRLTLTESEFGAKPGETSALQRVTELGYREIFALLDALSTPHLLRVWNYLPDINGESHGSERYWQFNSARQDAFIACGRTVTGAVPAACGVGSPLGTAIIIYFLASATAPTVIENPRQVSAYNYPPEYSPRSPTFSRACLADFSNGQMLFISGTASILGHATVHHGDAAAQAHETLRNIEALIDEANRVGGRRATFTMRSLCYKAYVRHAADRALIERELTQALGSRAQVLYLRSDLCRPDLLVEIEATGSHLVNDKS